jgi:hypothetical protein
MRRIEIDGVPVLWDQGPEPLRATLTFGVGARDETFRTLGVTHLIEHLAMSALPRVHYETNASVDLTVTEFTVCGRPEQVVEFLDAVCRSLAALPFDRIGKEAGVLAAEGGDYVHPTVAALLNERFGIRGLGLAVYHGPGYDRLSDEQVRAHAARFFVAGNAVLHLTGPPPADLRLPLPPGPLATHERPVPLPQTGPTWVQAMAPSVGVSLLGRRVAAWSTGMSVLADRLEQAARHERGLSYDVGGDGQLLGGDDTVVALTVDAREGQEATVAALVWDELRRFAAEGPTEAELEHHRAGVRELVADPRHVEVELANVTEGLLLGLPTRTLDDRLAALAEITPDSVRDEFAAGLPTTQIVVPPDVTLDLPGLTEGGCPRVRIEPPGKVFKPPLFAKLITRAARGLRLILTADGLAFRDPDGDVHIVRWSDVVGVEHDGGELTVFGSTGCHVVVNPDLFSGAAAAVAAVKANVPAELHYNRSDLLPKD